MKQDKEVDLEKEIKCFTMSKELYEADSAIKAVAEHFFELGLKVGKEERTMNKKQESEDEKIRKEMIFYFTEEIPQCSIQEHADKMKEFISWLKRQEVERTKLKLKAGNSYFCYKSRWERADSETFKKGLIYKCNKDGVLDNFIIKNPEQHFIKLKKL